MISKQTKIGIKLLVGALLCLCTGVALAATSGSSAPGGGIATIAQNVTGNLGSIAKLITAGSYVAGFGFAVAAILKFKAHKDNPQQAPLSAGVMLLFLSAALIFLPTVFKTTGATLFGSSGTQAGIAGISSFSS